ncbi:MAG: response regulator [Bacteroidales bacterium]|nr:response regulator [Bacteroidales bacterium]
MNETGIIKILVIEDELLIAEDIKLQLEELGYRVTGTASSFNEAQELAVAETPDLALVDIMISGNKDGIETAGYLKKHFEIPIIFLTSLADKATVDRAKQVNPDGYLVKPFNTNDLYTTIEIAFSNHAIKKDKPSEHDQQSGSFVLKDCIFIKKDYLLVKIRFDELMFIKAEGNYVEIYCKDKKFLTRSTLKDFLQKLPAGRFIQVHKSYAINIEQIDAIEYSNIIIGKESIPISRSFIDDLKKQIPFDF